MVQGFEPHPALPAQSLVQGHRHRLGRLIREKPMGFAALIVIVLLTIMAIFAPSIAPYNPYAPSSLSFSAPSMSHWLGTDQFGRDILSRVIYGSRISLVVGALSTAVGLFVGTSMGALAAYLGGWVEQAIMRLVDVMLAFPFILLALLLLAFFGQGLPNVTVAIGIAFIPNFARLAHATTLSVRPRAYVEAARASGAGTVRILLRHVVPNIVQPLTVYTTFSLPLAILIEASLDYLGLGVNPSTPTWGNIINQGQQSLLLAPWQAIAGGLAITVTVMAFNLLGQTFADLLDPKDRMRVRV